MTSLHQTSADGAALVPTSTEAPVADGHAAEPVATGDGSGRRMPRRSRRPLPARRLRRLHPKKPAAPGTGGPAEAVGEAEPSAPAGPMGVLVAAVPGFTAPAPQTAAGQRRRVDAQLVRLGRGTSLVVLPSWRAAIAVSVPTDLLLRETGLTVAELPDARLTVVINSEALHDRELCPAEWRTEAFRGR